MGKALRVRVGCVLVANHSDSLDFHDASENVCSNIRTVPGGHRRYSVSSSSRPSGVVRPVLIVT